MMTRRNFLFSSVGGAGLLAQSGGKRPNILLILADDLGYSDLGCFGGEIATPQLDALAKGGVRMAHFYNSARCCPSRASLMTGLYPHQTGLGNMTGARRGELEGYRGQMSTDNVTIPEALRDAGYSTLMCGKWHLGAPGPDERGFEEYFGLVGGFNSFWESRHYTRLPAGRAGRTYPEDKFYATDAITDHALDFLGWARGGGKPWFLYLAYNAPHFPLHAPKELIDKYQGVYEKGWDRIREERFARQKRLDLATGAYRFTPRSSIPANRFNTETGWAGKDNPAWESLGADRRKDLARRMATFAAMVESMDTNIGRVFDDLKKAGEWENTLIVFLSDNGACAEWDPYGFDKSSGPENVLHKGSKLEEMGQKGTYHSYGSGWANACNTPCRLYKHYSHEGGISTPFVAHWPKRLRARKDFERRAGHLVDLMPTLLGAAGARYPAERRGVKTPAMEGVDLMAVWEGKKTAGRELCFEHEGGRAVRDGNWKLVAVGPGSEWELYDLAADPTEMVNLAGKQPARVRKMSARWEAWAKRTKAVPWPWQPQWK